MSIAFLAAPALARRIAPLTVGHASVDFTQGSLPVLLPYLITRFDLSYVYGAALFVAMTVSSSITQPLFGRLSDRGVRYAMLPASVAISGIGLGVAALVPSYAVAIIAIFASGLGVAAYHPEASRLASAMSGDQRGTGMSLFSVGGNLGFALGAALTGLVTAAFGLDGGLLLLAPAALGVVFLVSARTAVGDSISRAVAVVHGTVDDLRSLVMLLIGLCLRGYVNFGMLAFIPLYETDMRGRSASYGAVVLTALLATGAAMTLLAGPLADRIGPRRTMVLLSIPVAPLTALYVADDGPLGVLAIVLAGGAVIGTFSVSIVLSQLYLPTRTALAAGLSIGLSIGVGGMFTIVIGAIADTFDLRVALWSVAAVAVTVIAVLMTLPPDRRS